MGDIESNQDNRDGSRLSAIPPQTPDSGPRQPLCGKGNWWTHLTSPVQDGVKPDLLLEIELLTLSLATGIQGRDPCLTNPSTVDCQR